jgi:SAM-dependent methyltransferase
MQLLFAFTLLVSATLLFLVQPMFAKMVLPRLGGTPAVWNTCMVFYQAVLLFGYLYAHLATRWLGTRRQSIAHLVVLCLPWLVLPIGIGAHWYPPADQNPIPWLLLLMAVSVGIPFFVVSASAPMLQAWFADTGHPSGRDPYFLYAASNLGSMAALLGYPTLVEPYLPLAGQSFWWAVGYGTLMVLTLACALALRWSPGRSAPADDSIVLAVPADSPAPAADEPQGVPTFGLRMRWLALAFAPSSLLLGVTTFICTDIAAVPLLWVIPLALYLLTFVLVFARWPILPHRLVVFVQPFVIVLLGIVFFKTTSSWMQWLVLLHLVGFFIAAMVCHGELARSRPRAVYLTEFYLWMSLGGVLGGLFNALVAPLVFPTVIEYPLVVAIACALRPWPRPARHPILARWLDLVLPILLFGVMWVLYHLHYDRGRLNEIPTLFRAPRWDFTWNWLDWLAGLNVALGWIHRHLAWLNNVPKWFGGKPWEWIGPNEWRLSLEVALLAIGGLVAFGFSRRPVRFGIAVGTVLFANILWFSSSTPTIYTERSFFGVMRVREYVSDLGNGRKRIEHTLVHGSTNHGAQWAELAARVADATPNPRDFWAPATKGRTPITYYYKTGPVGQVFNKLTYPERTKEVGVIGLGTGTTAAWMQPRQHLTYFEIDPTIRRIAHDRRLFTYVTDAMANGVDVDVEMGDARVSLENSARQPDGKFDLLIVDAFSSDAIPIHLLTQQAIELYFRRLAPSGVLLVHISNRHLELAPVLGNIARHLGRVCRLCNDKSVSDEEEEKGKFVSDWVILVRTEKDLGPLAKSSDWKPIPPDERVGLWTDDYSNIVAVLRWFRKVPKNAPEPAPDDQDAEEDTDAEE